MQFCYLNDLKKHLEIRRQEISQRDRKLRRDADGLELWAAILLYGLSKKWTEQTVYSWTGLLL